MQSLFCHRIHLQICRIGLLQIYRMGEGVQFRRMLFCRFTEKGVQNGTWFCSYAEWFCLSFFFFKILFIGLQNGVFTVNRMVVLRIRRQEIWGIIKMVHSFQDLQNWNFSDWQNGGFTVFNIGHYGYAELVRYSFAELRFDRFAEIGSYKWSGKGNVVFANPFLWTANGNEYFRKRLWQCIYSGDFVG